MVAVVPAAARATLVHPAFLLRNTSGSSDGRKTSLLSSRNASHPGLEPLFERGVGGKRRGSGSQQSASGNNDNDHK